MVTHRQPLPHISGEQARQIVRQSLAETIKAIGPSLGPEGRGVVYEAGTNQAGMAMSGCSIAKLVVGDRGFNSIVPRILQEAMLSLRRDLGDGSIRFACITNAIYQSASLSVSRGGNPGQISLALREAGLLASELLADARCDIPSIANIARETCDDNEIAALLGTLGDHLLSPGAIEVKEGENVGLELLQHEGFCLDISPDIAGVGPAEPRTRIEMDNVYLVVINEVISDLGPVAPVLNAFVQNNKSLVIIARGFVGQAAAALIDNRGKYCLKILGLVPEITGPQAVAILEDVCAATGATLIGDETGISLSAIQPVMLGQARNIIVDRNRCMLVEPAAEPTVVMQRQRNLLQEAQAQRYLALDHERLLRRAARLNGYWTELKIGGLNKWETQHRIEIAIAAIAAVCAARKQGVVAGGGQALADVADQLEKLERLATPHQHAAMQAIIAGCKATQAQLATNQTTNALNLNDGMVDPFSITETLFLRAVSVAATLLTIEVLV